MRIHRGSPVFLCERSQYSCDILLLYHRRQKHIDNRRDPDALPKFYEMLEKGDIPSTSQINEFRYEEFFEDQLKKVTFFILPSEQE